MSNSEYLSRSGSVVQILGENDIMSLLKTACEGGEKDACADIENNPYYKEGASYLISLKKQIRNMNSFLLAAKQMKSVL